MYGEKIFDEDNAVGDRESTLRANAPADVEKIYNKSSQPYK